ncbi:hypothetical protein QYE76_036102 [Lolium multiflorum]|uniref:Uncharacterized protein n=1 Tax=Lolium multiflorum TaxID=4521 RepID=A0AAD8R2Z2_LOLMU|nr:hypothetical protein QYE76_036102 [Lolium multiflorum]
MGKDRLPAPDPVGDRSSEEHFMRLRCAVKELDSACSRLTLGRPSLRSFYGNIGTSLRHMISAKGRRTSSSGSIRLSAQKTSYQELKSQFIQLGLDHAKALKAAEADAAAKMDEALEDAGNANSVLLAELEELAKAQKVAEEKAARLEAEQKECNRLVLQTDTHAYRLFPDSQRFAVKKVDEHRTAQGQENLGAPWTL